MTASQMFLLNYYPFMKNSLNYFYYYLLINLFTIIIIIIIILISVAFFTLFERKMLSYIHKRKGPNKASLLGLTQPFADAVKLFSKEIIYSRKTIYSVYIIRPIIIIIISLIIWIIFPLNFKTIDIKFSILFILCCFSVSVYPVIIGGWSSKSNYSLIGAIRGLSQSISYEIRLRIIMLTPIILCETLRLSHFIDYQRKFNLIIWIFPVFLIIYISRLAEVNRTPFDFIEGESELVSGFNVEYFGFRFAFIFLSEYSIIIWIRGLNVIIFIPNINFIFFTLLLSYGIIWVRGSFPRIRYDELIFLCWKIFLPIRIIFCRISIFIKYFISIEILLLKFLLILYK